MQKVKFSDIKPYARYVRDISNVAYKQFDYTIKAYDCRLFYCTGGKGNFEIDGNAYPLKAGVLLLFKYDVPYAYYPDKQDPMTLLGVNFDYVNSASNISTPIPPVKKENFDKNKILAPVTLDETLLEKPLVIDNAFTIESELKTLNSEFTRREILYETRCSSLLCSIITQALRLAVKIPLKNKDFDVIQNVINVLNEKYTEQITLSSLGNKFGYHPNYLGRLFKQYMHTSIHQYILSLRLSEAKNLICGTTLSFTEISAKAGFDDYAYFSAYFKKKSGMSPSDYRKYHINII
jgi:AraC-like DNA-binding protein